LTQNSPQVFKGGWDELENSVFTDNKTAIPNFPTTFTMSPDGTKVFALNTALESIDTYPLAIPYDYSTRGAITDTFLITVDGDPMGIHFKDDGTRMYITGRNTVRLYEFIVPIPFTPSSITDPPVSISLSALTGFVTNVVFSRDGDFVFITDDDGRIYTYPLPIPWDITSNITNNNFLIGGIAAHSLAFKSQGDKMYVLDIIQAKIFEVDLATPWDIFPFTVTPNTLDVDSVDRDLFLRSNGQELFTLNITGDSLKFHLDEDWNISTASHFTNAFPIPTGTLKFEIFWKPDGTKFFILGGGAIDTITEYTVPNPWNTDNAVEGANFNITPLDTNVQSMWWRKDGLRCYIVGLTNDMVHQLNVGTPWDVSTMSSPGIFFDLVGLVAPSGIYFRDDGKKFYIVDSFSTLISEFDMTTSFDITTTVLLQSTTIPGVTGSGTTGIDFRPDGKRLYLGDLNANVVKRFVLSTPWDTTTLIFKDSFGINAQDTTIRGISIREHNGKKLYIIGTQNNTVFSYDMTKEFDFAIIDELGDELVTELGDILVYQ